MSSWAGRFVGTMTGPAYSAAKFGVNAMTESLNMEECIHGIRATAVCPGEVATPILKSRPVEPSDAEKARMLQQVRQAIATPEAAPLRPEWARGL